MRVRKVSPFAWLCLCLYLTRILELAHEKAKQMIQNELLFSDFGTRRRRSYHGQDLVLQGLIRANKEFGGEEAEGKFMSTSNVSLFSVMR